MCTATGERVEESPPPLPIPSSPPSSPPPQMMKTLSVWIRKERCALAEGITVIKAMPPHLCMSIPLSTYNFSLYTQFWDSKLFMLLFMLQNCFFTLQFFYVELNGLLGNFDDQRQDFLVIYLYVFEFIQVLHILYTVGSKSASSG